jgi:adenylate cyclase
MEAQATERKLTTILSADVVGYSRLMGEDEAATLAALKTHRKTLIDPKLVQYRGRLIKLMGDGALMEFASVVDAVAFAVDVQCSMRRRNAEVPAERRLNYRMGINIGDVIVEGGDIYGDGVNVAARLESLAEPGGICVGRNVFDHVKSKLPLNFKHLGEREVKNIAEPVSVYQVMMDDKAEQLVTTVQVMASPRRPRRALVAGVLILFAALTGLVWWQPWTRAVEQAGLGVASVRPHQAASIAVLPFDNMSGGPEMDYFSDGMTEDIITALSMFPNLTVISRTSSFVYKGKSLTAQQIGQDLGVRYVLEGSVRKQDDKVRITAQLIDVATDAHVWSNRFDEEGTDIFALQDRIAARIDDTLAGHGGSIDAAEYSRVWAMDASQLEEYDYYLRGHSIFFDFTQEAMLKAREIFQEGLRKFPDSGLLRTKIGWTHFMFYELGFSDEPEKDLKRAAELAQEAFADQNMPRIGHWYGHWLKAFVQLFYKGNHQQALDEARIAVSYAPNHSMALADNATIAVYAGAEDEAIGWVTRAISVEPHAPDWYYASLGLAYHRKGDCPRAIEAMEKVSSAFPDFGLRYSAPLIDCYVKLQRLEDARAQMTQVLAAMPEVSVESMSRDLPYNDQTIVDSLLVSMREAGLPE